MLISLIIILTGLFFGWTLSFFFNFIDNLLKRIAFSIFFGFISVTWLSLFFSWLIFKQLGFASTLMTIIVLILASIFLWFKARERESIKLKPLTLSVLAVIALIIYIYASLNFSIVLFTNEREGWSGIVNVWGDYPFHLGLINSFVLRDNFPPQYPVLIGSPLTYSFATDYLTAIFVKNGLGLREAIWFVNIALFFCLVVFIFYLAEEFSSSRKVAAIALILFLFNSNAGIVNALGEAVDDPGVLLKPDRDFSHDGTSGLYFMNIIYAVFIPQRSVLLGFTAVLLVYLILFKNFSSGRQNNQEFLLAGLLSGLLPLMHAHSFIAVGVVAAFLFLYHPSRSWLYFIIPAALLSAPQIFWISQNVGSGTFFSVHLGWITMNESKPLINIFLFWLANGWVVLVLSFAALALASRKQLVFYIPFLALFFLGNIIRFQPWDWDNYKIFMHWYLFASIFAAIMIVGLFNAGAGFETRRRAAGKRWLLLRSFGFKALAVMFIILGVASAVLTMLWMTEGKNARYEVYSPVDLRIAEWIKVNTPDQAIFLTSDTHNNVVHSLAGRQILMASWWWLWSHGLDYSGVERDVKEIYLTGNCELIKKYNISYIFVSPQEGKLNPDIALFESRFERVFSDTNNIYNIFRTKC